jgi:undecaprenyl-diphosphatase
LSVLEAVVLGIVQGLTEFIPVSSTAHLVLVPAAFGWDTPPFAYTVMLHVGSLIAVVAYFWREILKVGQDLVRSGPGRRLALLIVAATIPAVVVGFLFEEPISRISEQPRVAAVTLLGTALVLVLSEVIVRRKGTTDRRAEDAVNSLASDVTWNKATAIGIGQAAAILPGFSRSAFTIGTGLMVGLDRAQSARFSFLMLIPALAGAAVLKVPEIGSVEVGWGVIAAGFVASLLASYFAVALMIGYLQRHGLYPFAAYCLVVGVLGTALLKS